MLNETVDIFFNLLWNNLLQQIPVDTYNMYRNTTFTKLENGYEITISGPMADGTDYARVVNERKNICRKHNISHYHWIQRTIEQTAIAMEGSMINYELY